MGCKKEWFILVFINLSFSLKLEYYYNMVFNTCQYIFYPTKVAHALVKSVEDEAGI